MATDTPESIHSREEYCPNCRRETHHSVSLEIRTESHKDSNQEFSREPYRVSECSACGLAWEQRMNNAAP
jgi:hypothetical protein